MVLLFSVDALTDILDAFVISENAAKMRMARESAGNDMLQVMQTVFPITVQIQMDVIKKYGFTPDGDGTYFLLVKLYCIKFAHRLCASNYLRKLKNSLKQGYIIIFCYAIMQVLSVWPSSVTVHICILLRKVNAVKIVPFRYLFNNAHSDKSVNQCKKIICCYKI